MLVVAVLTIVAATVLTLVLLVRAREPMPGFRDLAAVIRAFFGWPG